jgi:hypothetical protein
MGHARPTIPPLSSPAPWGASVEAVGDGAVPMNRSPLSGPIQPDLFSGTQVLERTLAGSGTVVRLRLRPLGAGRVRIEEAARRAADQRAFETWSAEAGRVVAFERLGFGVAYDEVFGGS